MFSGQTDGLGSSQPETIWTVEMAPFPENEIAFPAVYNSFQYFVEIIGN
jgi:hypothetical protein